uniref:Uncharacterized protein n=1 Tax=Vespula pensylvanica TaxID=30213 RepID=A0A834N5F0_VESPE|nr:hypothetical protein H0235_016484 [Vespula pensylvanica]
MTIVLSIGVGVSIGGGGGGSSVVVAVVVVLVVEGGGLVLEHNLSSLSDDVEAAAVASDSTNSVESRECTDWREKLSKNRNDVVTTREWYAFHEIMASFCFSSAYDAPLNIRGIYRD